ncbi:hypothetical protein H9655_11025 [Cytobacillus sp. Sa5YUA1]|uniref:Uncharacterized protein n=1 Tax=Cytobacillus stercorigallinarum TaxID=2762240 RepID=A0ABR8QPV4_9BACI|nr:hypothetical protein [Cytobacillus stercorigallinarum]MBD7937555.1 hypothetical protein [Cytobacillus stercorigallinarum]
MKKFFLNLMSIISFSPFITQVTQEDVTHNLRKLKEYSWFNAYLENEIFRNLIVHNDRVRNVIGEFNEKRFSHCSYQKKMNKRLNAVLLNEEVRTTV